MTRRVGLLTFALALAIALAACTDPEEDLVAPPGVTAPSQDVNGGTSPDVSGGIAEGATPPPQESANTPQPTPIPTPTSRIGVTGMTVSPATFVTLYPPGANPALELGLLTRQQFTATVTLSDGKNGSYEWEDRSGGKLSVTKGGLITVKPDTPAGLYQVDVVAQDDPSQKLTVTIQVKWTTKIDVTIS